MSSRNRVQYNAVNLLRYSIALVYIWFGALKFFNGFSPAEQIARQTIHLLTFGLLPDNIALILLATWECAVGILLLINKAIKPTLVLLFIHLVLTFSPFLFFPQATFQHMPYSFTIIGQYIFKNIIIISAAWVVWQSEKVVDAPSAERRSIRIAKLAIPMNRVAELTEA